NQDRACKALLQIGGAKKSISPCAMYMDVQVSREAWMPGATSESPHQIKPAPARRPNNSAQP
ncbi:MAG: hypothetical protein WBN90_08005, partial [Gammaproteobacteria bacterium]